MHSGDGAAFNINSRYIMKRIIILLILIVSSCSTTNQKGIISYVVDISAEKSIYEVVSQKSNICFYMQALGDSKFKIYLIENNDKEFLITNRKLFINNKFYPIIFESDYIFYSQVKDGKPMVSYEEQRNIYKEIPMPSIEQREKQSDQYGYLRRRLIIDYAPFWIIDEKGKLVSKG